MCNANAADGADDGDAVDDDDDLFAHANNLIHNVRRRVVLYDLNIEWELCRWNELEANRMDEHHNQTICE